LAYRIYFTVQLCVSVPHSTFSLNRYMCRCVAAFTTTTVISLTYSFQSPQVTRTVHHGLCLSVAGRGIKVPPQNLRTWIVCLGCLVLKGHPVVQNAGKLFGGCGSVPDPAGELTDLPAPLAGGEVALW